MQDKGSYLSPEVREVRFFVEHGFAGSLENPSEQPEIDW